MVDFKKLQEEMESGEWERKKKQREAEEELRQQIIRQTACFTGHRPNHLFGYNLKDNRYKTLYKKLTETIELCINEENITRFISGGAIGTDQISYWLVYKLKEKYPDIKNIVAIPFKNQPNAWKDKNTIRWYSKMLERADEIIYVDDIDDFRYRTNEVPVGEYHIGKMQRRNEWMVDNSRIVLAVYDGFSKGGTKNCINYAKKNYKNIIYINYNKLEVD